MTEQTHSDLLIAAVTINLLTTLCGLNRTGALAKNKTVVLHIAGQRYAIKTDADARYLADLAQFVEERYTKIQEGSQGSPPYKLAILTALNIADDLFRKRSEEENLKRRVRNKSQRMLAILDSALRGLAETRS